LPGVNAAGTQSTTGNAATATTAAACSGNAASATKLQTARTINGVSFDGTKNINIDTQASVGGYQTLVDDTVYTNTGSKANLVFIRLARGSTNGGSGLASIVIYPKELGVPPAEVSPYNADGKYTVFHIYLSGYTAETYPFLVPSGWSYYVRQNGMYAAKRTIVEI
jgi:hypothetical protein